ncbi:organic solute transporter Ostalpha-domain-containing protein [Lineolata rhizophorae]|uniref:Organic solute transporter Ostalpha-domain-containing protein n=1 Tax=Lineolata rhizophorae TaxID=578093 RepID=A0A6A6NY83_9PEZI|nr:organic solute transporter Ostalpha-domain-containing protein [Lineolata rhizophorae]
MPSCNETTEIIDEEPLFASITFHVLGLIISAVFGLSAVLIAGWLIFRHATHYSVPYEQKHIIRILFMIPIYAVVSLLSFLFYKHAIYFEVIRDCYEAFAIAAFFTLMCHYIAPTLHDQKNFFRALEPHNWIWPLPWAQKCTGGKDKGWFRRPASGLTWFNIIWIGIFSYCVIRVFFTIVSVVSQHFDRYCETSLSPVFAHIWVLVFEATSVTIAMYCLIQFYAQLRGELAPHRPFLKVLCIKLVIFFCFWQALLVSFLVSSEAIKPSEKISMPDIKTGIPSFLVCVEMAGFAILHVVAFPWKPYVLPRLDSDDSLPEPSPSIGTESSNKPQLARNTGTKYHGGPLGILALVDAFNIWDLVKASARGIRWLFCGVKSRKQDVSYQRQGGAGGAGDALELRGEGKAASVAPYAGPTFAGNGEAAVMVDGTDAGSTGAPLAAPDRKASDDESATPGAVALTPGTTPGAAGTPLYNAPSNEDYFSSSYPPPDDDRAGLLSHAAGRQQASRAPYPSHSRFFSAPPQQQQRREESPFGGEAEGGRLAAQSEPEPYGFVEQGAGGLYQRVWIIPMVEKLQCYTVCWDRTRRNHDFRPHGAQSSDRRHYLG